MAQSSCLSAHGCHAYSCLALGLLSGHCLLLKVLLKWSILVSDIILLDLPECFDRSTSSCATLPQVLKAGHDKARQGRAGQSRTAPHIMFPTAPGRVCHCAFAYRSTDRLACGAQRTSGAGGFGLIGSPRLLTPCAPWLLMSLPQPTGRQCISTTPTSRLAVQFWRPLGFRQGIGGSGWGWLCCWAMQWSSISLPP